ncbi:MAG: methyltransferase domain-containing protein, partial [Candidatus Omnitrophica bacterium]|nr:methyltransferase domain-containing protein [Candidatus Omnitrophota bacterium]
MEEKIKKEENKPKFKTWLRAVALLVVVVFVPEHAAWAMGYDPSVLWAPRYYLGAGQAGYMANFVSENVRRSLNYLAHKPLNQIEIAPNLIVDTTPLQLKQAESSGNIADSSFGSRRSARINIVVEAGLKAIIKVLEFISYYGKSKEEIANNPSPGQELIRFLKRGHEFTRNLPQGDLASGINNAAYQEGLYLTGADIKKICDWIKDPATQIDNYCGVYALHRLLKAQGKEITLEELALRVILVDLLTGNIKELKGRLKTSLYALQKVAESFGLKAQALKVEPLQLNNESIDQLIPFIAHLNSEHFIYVTRLKDDMLYYYEKEEEEIMPRDLLINKISGYLLSINAPKQLSIPAPQDTKSVWGGYSFQTAYDRERSKQLGARPKDAWSDPIKAAQWGMGDIHHVGNIKWTYGDVANIALDVGLNLASAGLASSALKAGTTAARITQMATTVAKYTFYVYVASKGASIFLNYAGQKQAANIIGAPSAFVDRGIINIGSSIGSGLGWLDKDLFRTNFGDNSLVKNTTGFLGGLAKDNENYWVNMVGRSTYENAISPAATSVVLALATFSAGKIMSSPTVSARLPSWLPVLGGRGFSISNPLRLSALSVSAFEQATATAVLNGAIQAGFAVPLSQFQSAMSGQGVDVQAALFAGIRGFSEGMMWGYAFSALAKSGSLLKRAGGWISSNVPGTSRLASYGSKLGNIAGSFTNFALQHPHIAVALKGALIGGGVNTVRGYLDARITHPYSSPLDLQMLQDRAIDFGVGTGIGFVTYGLASYAPSVGTWLTTPMGKEGALRPLYHGLLNSALGGAISVAGGYLTPVSTSEGYKVPLLTPELQPNVLHSLLNFGAGFVAGGVLGSYGRSWLGSIKDNFNSLAGIEKGGVFSKFRIPLIGKEIMVENTAQRLALASLEGALTFSVIVPTWDLVDLPIYYAWNRAINGQDDLDEAIRETIFGGMNFKKGEGLKQLTASNIALALLSKAAQGAQMGLYLGPMLKIISPSVDVYLGSKFKLDPSAAWEKAGRLEKIIYSLSADSSISGLGKSIISSGSKQIPGWLTSGLVGNVAQKGALQLAKGFLGHISSLGFTVGVLEGVKVTSRALLAQSFPGANPESIKQLSSDLSFSALFFMPHLPLPTTLEKKPVQTRLDEFFDKNDISSLRTNSNKFSNVMPSSPLEQQPALRQTTLDEFFGSTSPKTSTSAQENIITPRQTTLYEFLGSPSPEIINSKIENPNNLRQTKLDRFFGQQTKLDEFFEPSSSPTGDFTKVGTGFRDFWNRVETEQAFTKGELGFKDFWNSVEAQKHVDQNIQDIIKGKSLTARMAYSYEKFIARQLAGIMPEKIGADATGWPSEVIDLSLREKLSDAFWKTRISLSPTQRQMYETTISTIISTLDESAGFSKPMQYREGQIATAYVAMNAAEHLEPKLIALGIGRGKTDAQLLAANQILLGLLSNTGELKGAENAVELYVQGSKIQDYMDSYVMKVLNNDPNIRVRVLEDPGNPFTLLSNEKLGYVPLNDVSSKYGIESKPDAQLELRILETQAVNHRARAFKYADRFEGLPLEEVRSVRNVLVDDPTALMSQPSQIIAIGDAYSTITDLQAKARADSSMRMLREVYDNLAEEFANGRVSITNPWVKDMKAEDPNFRLIDMGKSKTAIGELYDVFSKSSDWKQIEGFIQEKYNLGGQEAFEQICNAWAQTVRMNEGDGGSFYSKYISTDPESYKDVNYNLNTSRGIRNNGTHHGDSLTSAMISIKSIEVAEAKGIVVNTAAADIYNALHTTELMDISFAESLSGDFGIDGKRFIHFTGTPGRDQLAFKNLGAGTTVISEQKLLTLGKNWEIRVFDTAGEAVSDAIKISQTTKADNVLFMVRGSQEVMAIAEGLEGGGRSVIRGTGEFSEGENGLFEQLNNYKKSVGAGEATVGVFQGDITGNNALQITNKNTGRTALTVNFGIDGITEDTQLLYRAGSGKDRMSIPEGEKRTTLVGLDTESHITERQRQELLPMSAEGRAREMVKIANQADAWEARRALSLVQATMQVSASSSEAKALQDMFSSEKGISGSGEKTISSSVRIGSVNNFIEGLSKLTPQEQNNFSALGFVVTNTAGQFSHASASEVANRFVTNGINLNTALSTANRIGSAVSLLGSGLRSADTNSYLGFIQRMQDSKNSSVDLMRGLVERAESNNTVLKKGLAKMADSLDTAFQEAKQKEKNLIQAAYVHPSFGKALSKYQEDNLTAWQKLNAGFQVKTSRSALAYVFAQNKLSKASDVKYSKFKDIAQSVKLEQPARLIPLLRSDIPATHMDNFSAFCQYIDKINPVLTGNMKIKRLSDDYKSFVVGDQQMDLSNYIKSFFTKSASFKQIFVGNKNANASLLGGVQADNGQKAFSQTIDNLAKVITQGTVLRKQDIQLQAQLIDIVNKDNKIKKLTEASADLRRAAEVKESVIKFESVKPALDKTKGLSGFRMATPRIVVTRDELLPVVQELANKAGITEKQAFDFISPIITHRFDKDAQSLLDNRLNKLAEIDNTLISTIPLQTISNTPETDWNQFIKTGKDSILITGAPQADIKLWNEGLAKLKSGEWDIAEVNKSLTEVKLVNMTQSQWQDLKPLLEKFAGNLSGIRRVEVIEPTSPSINGGSPLAWRDKNDNSKLYLHPLAKETYLLRLAFNVKVNNVQNISNRDELLEAAKLGQPKAEDSKGFKTLKQFVVDKDGQLYVQPIKLSPGVNREELKALPGIGTELSVALEDRINAGIQTLNDLRIDGKIGDKRLNRIMPYIELPSNPAPAEPTPPAAGPYPAAGPKISVSNKIKTLVEDYIAPLNNFYQNPADVVIARSEALRIKKDLLSQISKLNEDNFAKVGTDNIKVGDILVDPGAENLIKVDEIKDGFIFGFSTYKGGGKNAFPLKGIIESSWKKIDFESLTLETPKIPKPPSLVENKTEIGSEFSNLIPRVSIQVDGRKVTSGADLLQNGFVPQYKISLNGMDYYLSKPYTSQRNGRPYFIGFLHRINPETGVEEIFARTIYKSNSQNIWRIASSEGPGGWIGKGLEDEMTTNAPLEIQSSLEKLCLDNGKLEIKEGFYDDLEKRADFKSPEEFNHTILLHGEELNGGISIGSFAETGNPESYRFQNGFEPDFNNGVIEEFNTYSPIYGDVESYRMLSNNKQVQFVFNVDRENRVWIGAVQSVTPRFTRFGVRADRIDIGAMEMENIEGVNRPVDILMPASEYDTQIPKGYIGNHKADRYYDASPFIDKIPVIKEFRQKVLEKNVEAPKPIEAPALNAAINNKISNIGQPAVVKSVTAEKTKLAFTDLRLRDIAIAAVKEIYPEFNDAQINVFIEDIRQDSVTQDALPRMPALNAAINNKISNIGQPAVVKSAIKTTPIPTTPALASLNVDLILIQELGKVKSDKGLLKQKLEQLLDIKITDPKVIEQLASQSEINLEVIKAAFPEIEFPNSEILAARIANLEMSENAKDLNKMFEQQDIGKRLRDIGKRFGDWFDNLTAPKPPSQIGKVAIVESIKSIKGTTAATIIDLQGKPQIIKLTPQPALDIPALKSQIESMQDIDQIHKQTLLKVLSLLENSPPPTFCTFSDIVGDLFGFASTQPAQPNLIALHQTFAKNPIALFHEIGEYLTKTGAMELTLDRNKLTIKDKVGNILGEVTLTEGKDYGLKQAQKDPNRSHYLLRALQREIFREADIKLTQDIKSTKVAEVPKLPTSAPPLTEHLAVRQPSTSAEVTAIEFSKPLVFELNKANTVEAVEAVLARFSVDVKALKLEAVEAVARSPDKVMVLKMNLPKDVLQKLAAATVPEAPAETKIQSNVQVEYMNGLINGEFGDVIIGQVENKEKVIELGIELLSELQDKADDYKPQGITFTKAELLGKEYINVRRFAQALMLRDKGIVPRPQQEIPAQANQQFKPKAESVSAEKIDPVKAFRDGGFEDLLLEGIKFKFGGNINKVDFENMEAAIRAISELDENVSPGAIYRILNLINTEMSFKKFAAVVGFEALRGIALEKLQEKKEGRLPLTYLDENGLLSAFLNWVLRADLEAMIDKSRNTAVVPSETPETKEHKPPKTKEPPTSTVGNVEIQKEAKSTEVKEIPVSKSVSEGIKRATGEVIGKIKDKIRLPSPKSVSESILEGVTPANTAPESTNVPLPVSSDAPLRIPIPPGPNQITSFANKLVAKGVPGQIKIHMALPAIVGLLPKIGDTLHHAVTILPTLGRGPPASAPIAQIYHAFAGFASVGALQVNTSIAIVAVAIAAIVAVAIATVVGARFVPAKANNTNKGTPGAGSVANKEEGSEGVTTEGTNGSSGTAYSNIGNNQGGNVPGKGNVSGSGIGGKVVDLFKQKVRQILGSSRLPVNKADKGVRDVPAQQVPKPLKGSELKPANSKRTLAGAGNIIKVTVKIVAERISELVNRQPKQDVFVSNNERGPPIVGLFVSTQANISALNQVQVVSFLAQLAQIINNLTQPQTMPAVVGILGLAAIFVGGALWLKSIMPQSIWTTSFVLLVKAQSLHVVRKLEGYFLRLAAMAKSIRATAITLVGNHLLALRQKLSARVSKMLTWIRLQYTKLTALAGNLQGFKFGLGLARIRSTFRGWWGAVFGAAEAGELAGLLDVSEETALADEQETGLPNNKTSNQTEDNTNVSEEADLFNWQNPIGSLNSENSEVLYFLHNNTSGLINDATQTAGVDTTGVAGGNVAGQNGIPPSSASPNPGLGHQPKLPTDIHSGSSIHSERKREEDDADKTSSRGLSRIVFDIMVNIFQSLTRKNIRDWTTVNVGLEGRIQQIIRTYTGAEAKINMLKALGVRFVRAPPFWFIGTANYVDEQGTTYVILPENASLKEIAYAFKANSGELIKELTPAEEKATGLPNNKTSDQTGDNTNVSEKTATAEDKATGLFGGRNKTNDNNKSETVKTLLSLASGVNILIFSEFHTLKFTSLWFINNVLPFLSNIGINDLITEYINVEVGDNWDSICQVLNEYTLDAYKWLQSEKEKRDIGIERAKREYPVAKINWLRTKLNAGELPYLKKNLAWMGDADDVLLFIIIAADKGIRLHGATTPDMNVTGGLSLYESYIKVTEIAQNRITELRKNNKKVAGYFGVPHGIVKESGIIYFKMKDLGAAWMSQHPDIADSGEGVSYKDIIFSFAPKLIAAGEKYLNVLLLVGDEKDLRSVRYKIMIENISDIIKKLGKGQHIEYDRSEKTATIIIRERSSSLYSARIRAMGVVGGEESAEKASNLGLVSTSKNKENSSKNSEVEERGESVSAVEAESQEEIINVGQGGARMTNKEKIRLFTRNIATCTGLALKGIDRAGKTVLLLAHIRQGQPSDDPAQPYRAFGEFIKKFVNEGIRDIEAVILYDNVFAETVFPTKEEILNAYPQLKSLEIENRKVKSEDDTKPISIGDLFNANMGVTDRGVKIDFWQYRGVNKVGEETKEINWAVPMKQEIKQTERKIEQIRKERKASDNSRTVAVVGGENAEAKAGERKENASLPTEEEFLNRLFGMLAIAERMGQSAKISLFKAELGQFIKEYLSRAEFDIKDAIVKPNLSRFYARYFKNKESAQKVLSDMRQIYNKYMPLLEEINNRIKSRLAIDNVRFTGIIFLFEGQDNPLRLVMDRATGDMKLGINLEFVLEMSKDIFELQDIIHEAGHALITGIKAGYIPQDAKDIDEMAANWAAVQIASQDEIRSFVEKQLNLRKKIGSLSSHPIAQLLALARVMGISESGLDEFKNYTEEKLIKEYIKFYNSLSWSQAKQLRSQQAQAELDKEKSEVLSDDSGIAKDKQATGVVKSTEAAIAEKENKAGERKENAFSEEEIKSLALDIFFRVLEIIEQKTGRKVVKIIVPNVRFVDCLTDEEQAHLNYIDTKIKNAIPEFIKRFKEVGLDQKTDVKTKLQLWLQVLCQHVTQEELQEKERLEDKLSPHLAGQYNPERHEIKYSKEIIKIDPELMIEKVTHEVLHAIRHLFTVIPEIHTGYTDVDRLIQLYAQTEEEGTIKVPTYVMEFPAELADIVLGKLGIRVKSKLLSLKEFRKAAEYFKGGFDRKIYKMLDLTEQMINLFDKLIKQNKDADVIIKELKQAQEQYYKKISKLSKEITRYVIYLNLLCPEQLPSNCLGIVKGRINFILQLTSILLTKKEIKLISEDLAALKDEFIPSKELIEIAIEPYLKIGEKALSSNVVPVYLIAQLAKAENYEKIKDNWEQIFIMDAPELERVYLEGVVKEIDSIISEFKSKEAILKPSHQKFNTNLWSVLPVAPFGLLPIISNIISLAWNNPIWSLGIAAVGAVAVYLLKRTARIQTTTRDSKEAVANKDAKEVAVEAVTINVAPARSSSLLTENSEVAKSEKVKEGAVVDNSKAAEANKEFFDKVTPTYSKKVWMESEIAGFISSSLDGLQLPVNYKGEKLIEVLLDFGGGRGEALRFIIEKLNENKYRIDQSIIVDITSLPIYNGNPIKRLIYAIKNLQGYNDQSIAKIRSDAMKVPFKDESADVILCTFALQYIPEPKEALKEIERVLKPGARAVLIFHHSTSYTAKCYGEWVKEQNTFGEAARTFTRNLPGDLLRWAPKAAEEAGLINYKTQQFYYGDKYPFAFGITVEKPGVKATKTELPEKAGNDRSELVIYSSEPARTDQNLARPSRLKMLAKDILKTIGYLVAVGVAPLLYMTLHELGHILALHALYEGVEAYISFEYAPIILYAEISQLQGLNFLGHFFGEAISKTIVLLAGDMIATPIMVALFIYFAKKVYNEFFYTRTCKALIAVFAGLPLVAGFIDIIGIIKGINLGLTGDLLRASGTIWSGEYISYGGMYKLFDGSMGLDYRFMLILIGLTLLVSIPPLLVYYKYMMRGNRNKEDTQTKLGKNKGLIATEREKETLAKDSVKRTEQSTTQHERNGLEVNRSNAPPLAVSISKGSYETKETVIKEVMNVKVRSVQIRSRIEKLGELVYKRGIQAQERRNQPFGMPYNAGLDTSRTKDGERVLDTKQLYQNISDYLEARITKEEALKRAGLSGTVSGIIFRFILTYIVKANLITGPPITLTNGQVVLGAVVIINNQKYIYIATQYTLTTPTELAKDITKTLIHEIGAYFGISHTINKKLENLTQLRVLPTVAGGIFGLAATVVLEAVKSRIPHGYLTRFATSNTTNERGGVFTWLRSILGILGSITWSSSAMKELYSLVVERLRSFFSHSATTMATYTAVTEVLIGRALETMKLRLYASRLGKLIGKMLQSIESTVPAGKLWGWLRLNKTGVASLVVVAAFGLFAGRFNLDSFGLAGIPSFVLVGAISKALVTRIELLEDLLRRMFERIGNYAGYGDELEQIVGIRLVNEETHCIFGSCVRWLMYKNGDEKFHIKESLRFLLSHLEEYSKPLYLERHLEDNSEYAKKAKENLATNAGRVLKEAEEIAKILKENEGK